MTLAVASALLLAACGFQPLYGKRVDTDVSARLATVAIDIIVDRRGQLLRNALLDRITPRGAPARPRYRLAVSLSESKLNQAVRKDDTATRARLTLTASFSVLDGETGEQVFAGSARSDNSYNISTSDFGTISAEADARRRGTRDLADDITGRVAIFLSQIGQSVGQR